MGVPQGGILSVTLFILKSNSIADVIPSSFEKSLFVDDFSISCSQNMVKGEDMPCCIPCHCSNTVKPILLDCIDLCATRIKYYRDVNNLKDLNNVKDVEIFLMSCVI